MITRARIRARALRVLLAVCIFIPFFAYAAGTDVTDARAVWVALSGSVLKVSPADGSVSLTLPGTPAPQGFAVDQDDESVWIYSKKSLESFDLQGNPLLSASLPNNFHGGTPDGMAVDNSVGNIWIAIQKDLYQIDMAGAVKNDIRLSANAVGITLDPTRSRLWVAEQDGIQVFDASGTDQLSVSLSGAPVAIAYDKTLDQVWVSSSGQIARYSNSGVLVLSVPLASGLGSLVAVDGQGGLWTASGQNLAYLNSAGQTQFEVQPFAGEDGGDAVDLVADVLNHSAWVANTLHLRQYGSNGSFIKEAILSLPSGNGQAVQRLGIYVDTIPPSLSITAPASGTYTNHNKPTLVLSYSDIGSGVDATSVAVTSNGVSLPVTCTANADNSGTSCTPNAVLPDGGYSLSITVKDKAGNVSQPATVSFTVDTVPPTITVTSPGASGGPSYTLIGSLSEPGTLSIDGLPAIVDLSNSFKDTLTLNVGLKNIVLTATDLAGNVATLNYVVNYQPIPLAAPAGALVGFQPNGVGTQTLAGQAGAANAGENVTVTDVNTGQIAAGMTQADGSFTVGITGSATDNYSIVLSDITGNSSQPAYLHPTDPIMQVSVSSPANGSSVDGDDIAVSGTYAGPLNMGITVNGQPAVLLDGRFFVNNVKLAAGSNTLTVVATTGGNLQLNQTVSVTSLGPNVLVVTPVPACGFAPLNVNFQIQALGSSPLDEVDFAMGDGSNRTIWGFEIGEYQYPLSYTYQASGIYTVNVTAYDDNGVQYQTQVLIAVEDPGQTDALFTGIWSDVTGALSAGNKAAAMNALDYTAQQNYGPVFDELLPQMHQITSGFSPLMQSSVGTSNAEYIVVRNQAGQKNAYFVDFIKDMDGVWRVDSM